jgi:malonate transporter
VSALLDVILPVFLLIGFGYAAARGGLFDDGAVDGVMRYAQSFAAPCLLFRSISNLDLSTAYNAGLLVSFYAGAFVSFGVCFFGARLLFHRPISDAIAIGFAGMFSNSLLLGLPITERAYGPEALVGNYAIISIHSPLIYAFGIALMETSRASGQGLRIGGLLWRIVKSIFSQPLVLGICAGYAVNLSGQPLPGPAQEAVSMMADTTIPAALFGLGGVLLRYRPEGDRATIAMICVASLVVHPGMTYILGHWLIGIDTASLRSATLTAAMAPGVNAYMFAHLYGVAKRVNASAVLFATALSIGTTWVWLAILP